MPQAICSYSTPCLYVLHSDFAGALNPLPALCSCCWQQAEADRKRDTKPSQTLFVVNFDVQRVRERDIERYFDYYGKIKRVQIKKTYAFVQVRPGRGNKHLPAAVLVDRVLQP